MLHAANHYESYMCFCLAESRLRLLLLLCAWLQLADRLNRIAAELSRPQKLGVMLQVGGGVEGVAQR
jgi:hypothetical protein